MSLVPKHIKNLLPYIPGKPISELSREKGINNVIKLASNENPYGPSSYAIEKIIFHLSECHRYPDSSGYDLRSTLAEKYSLSINNVIIGSGSEGLRIISHD